MNEHEKAIMTMIANAGEAKSYGFEAMQQARAGKYKEAEESLKKGNKAAIEANKAHFSMLGGDHETEFSILLMHAEDQMITSQLILELAVEMIEMNKKINEK